MRKKKEAKVDHCAVDPAFEGMIWQYIGNDSLHGSSIAEMVLWRKVIIQALLDFCSISMAAPAVHNRAAAERWLLYNKNRFVFVCEYADVNPERLRLMIQKAYNNPDTIMMELRARLSRA